MTLQRTRFFGGFEIKFENGLPTYFRKFEVIQLRVATREVTEMAEDLTETNQDFISLLTRTLMDTEIPWRRDPESGIYKPNLLDTQTISELYAQADKPPEWLWQGFLERGEVMMIPADPKAGKSTFLGPLTVALLRGQGFLGYPTNASKILFASEEAAPAVARRLRKLGVVPEEENLIRITKLTLPDDIVKLVRTCIAVDANVVIIDTMATFFDLESENSNAEMAQVLNPLIDLARRLKVSIITAQQPLRINPFAELLRSLLRWIKPFI